MVELRQELKTEDRIFIRLDLNGEMAQAFNHLKKKRGILNNSEMVRLLINQEYERVFGPEAHKKLFGP